MRLAWRGCSVEHQHTLEPILDPLVFVGWRNIENDISFAGEGWPKVRWVRMGIKKAREMGLDAVQGFLELGASIHGRNLSRVFLTA